MACTSRHDWRRSIACRWYDHPTYFGDLGGRRLRQCQALEQISDWTIIYIVLGILTVLFFLQQFGTASIGKLFGPIMSLWFIMMGVLGISHISDDWSIFKAFSPYYAIKFLD